MFNGGGGLLGSHESGDHVFRTSPSDQWLFDLRKTYLDRNADISLCSVVTGVDESVLIVAELSMRANLSQAPSINQNWSHLSVTQSTPSHTL